MSGPEAAHDAPSSFFLFLNDATVQQQNLNCYVRGLKPNPQHSLVAGEEEQTGRMSLKTLCQLQWARKGLSQIGPNGSRAFLPRREGEGSFFPSLGQLDGPACCGTAGWMLTVKWGILPPPNLTPFAITKSCPPQSHYKESPRPPHSILT